MSELQAAARRARIPESDLLEQIATVPFRPSPMLPSAAEEFRMLRTRLNHIRSVQSAQAITISSPSPGEGKSFVAANLAWAQAQLKDSPTLLCDFDFHNAALHAMFGIERAPGLTDYLENRTALSEVVRRVADTNLYILPAGTQVTNPLELVTPEKLGQTMDRLRELFKWIILDTPPLLSTADGALLSSLSDGVVLVVRIGTTDLRSIPLAVQSLCRNNVLGVVVNGSPLES